MHTHVIFHSIYISICRGVHTRNYNNCDVYVYQVYVGAMCILYDTYMYIQIHTYAYHWNSLELTEGKVKGHRAEREKGKGVG